MDVTYRGAGRWAKTDYAANARIAQTEQLELGRFPCSQASVREVQVWCTRLPEGNEQAEFLLKAVAFRGDSFFSYQEPPSDHTWSWMIVGLVLLNGGSIALYWRSQKARH